MCLKNLTLLSRQHITDFLQVFFSIIESSLKIKHINISDNLNNFVIKLTLNLESDISDVSLINICASKQLYFIIIKKDLVSDFLANIIKNIFILIIFDYIMFD